ncbi:MAG: hypothetical protein JNK02_10220 [Planctomycetes bacterium]|nr:hypothetical protein [Planctomycetota bacterium]
MTLTTKTTVAGLAVALAAAFVLGGRQGSGALAGFLAGAFTAGLALVVQRRLARTRPELLAASVLAGFLLKACAMLATTLAVRFVPVLADAFDAVAFLFGFAGAALLVLGPATLETLRGLGPRAKPGVTEPNPS